MFTFEFSTIFVVMTITVTPCSKIICQKSFIDDCVGPIKKDNKRLRLGEQN